MATKAKPAKKTSLLDTVTATLVEITIPAEYVRLAKEWHMGAMCALASVASLGRLEPGSRRSYSDQLGRFMTDYEWDVSNWISLASSIRMRCRGLEKIEHPDAGPMREFEAFCNETVARLRDAYGLKVAGPEAKSA
jgi:hypothetical protein